MNVVLRIVAVAFGVCAGVVALLVLAANRQWAEFVVPAAPWSGHPRIVTLEVRVWALLLVPFLLGVASAVLLLWSRRRRRRRRMELGEETTWPTDRDLPV